jgi:hypothetical protein
MSNLSNVFILVRMSFVSNVQILLTEYSFDLFLEKITKSSIPSIPKHLHFNSQAIFIEIAPLPEPKSNTLRLEEFVLNYFIITIISSEDVPSSNQT